MNLGRLARLGLAGAVAVALTACSHVATEDRYHSKAQVVRFTECGKLEALRRFEKALFKVGFVREVVRKENPVPFELVEHLSGGEPVLVEFRKSDFKALGARGSDPYREAVNRYKISACEEPGGELFVIVVRHDPDSADQFLGARMTEALGGSGCQWRAIAPARELGFYSDTTEDDLLRHIRRGQCSAYARQ
ncbi:MAG: hypothetical protein HY075_10655 [Deltaproteobacteria bacterium]|nr:hypothetical protein [Deltaproteobacteria bacterium]